MKAIWTQLAERGHGRIPNGGLKVKKEKKPVRPITKKLSAQRKQYLKQRKEFLREYRLCDVGMQWKGIHRATEVHHRAGRGRNLLKEETWLAVCEECHAKIHREPAWAYANGYLERRT